jgi:hypothetical protein
MSELWGLYPWWPEHGLEFIHSDDRAQPLRPCGVVWQVVGEDAEYLVFQAGDVCFRAKPVLFQPIARPRFGYGELVRTRPPRTIRECTVVGIYWHGKREEPVYYLQQNGKRLSRRYWADELEGVTIEPDLILLKGLPS